MIKERTFQKKVTIENFKELKTNSLYLVGRSNQGKTVKETAEIIVEVFYTPKGYRCEVVMSSPLFTWDVTQACKIHGINDDFPEGDLVEKNFETALAAMHFITRRLRRLGWEAMDTWHENKKY